MPYSSLILLFLRSSLISSAVDYETSSLLLLPLLATSVFVVDCETSSLLLLEFCALFRTPFNHLRI